MRVAADLGKVRKWWRDILRLIGSIYTGQVNSYDVVRMLQRDGHPTALGEAINTVIVKHINVHGRYLVFSGGGCRDR